MGCAFTIPDHDACGRFKLNKGLSIFTAELYAICKALLYADTLEHTPNGVAILSDSKSSLQALGKGGTRNRSTLQQEALYLAHKLIAKGCDVTLMWLPSHTGIRGNDLADQAAKEATREGMNVFLNLSLSEMKSRLTAAACRKREQHFKRRCDDHGWLTLPVGKSCLTTIPRRNQKVLTRIRTVGTVGQHFPKPCLCGEHITLFHILSGCASLPQTSQLQELLELKRTHTLNTADFLRPHKDLGIRPQRLLSDAIVCSDLLRPAF